MLPHLICKMKIELIRLVIELFFQSKFWIKSVICLIEPFDHIIQQGIVILVSRVRHTSIDECSKDRGQFFGVLWAHGIVLFLNESEAEQHPATKVIPILKSIEEPELVQNVHCTVQLVGGTQRLSPNDTAIFLLPIIVGAENLNQLLSIVVAIPGKPFIDFLLTDAERGPFVELLVVD